MKTRNLIGHAMLFGPAIALVGLIAYCAGPLVAFTVAVVAGAITAVAYIGAVLTE